MNRLADKVLALVLAVVAAACLAQVYPLIDILAGRGLAGLDVAMLRPAAYSAAALACFIGALLFLAGQLPGRPVHAAGVLLFGRDAELEPAGRPRLRRTFLVLPVVVLLALLGDGFGSWRPHEGGEHVASAPPMGSVPKPESPSPVARTPPLPPALPSEQAATPPAAANPPALPVQPAPPVAEPAVPPASTAPMPPEVAVIPPPTVAPLPPSPDGRSIMSASTDHTIKLWDMGGKHLMRNLGVHKDMARTALYMPDGTSALTAGDDGEIVQRKLADGAVLHVFQSGQNGGVNKLAISPDGRRAVSGHDTGNVIIWDLVNGSVLHVLTGHDWSISAVAVSPDGKQALSGSIDGTLKLWDIDSGKQLRSWHGHEQGTYGAVFTADGHHLITGSGDLTIKVWDVDSGREVKRFEGHEGTVYALVLSADGKHLLSGSLDGTARLWDMASGNQIAMFDSQTGPIYAVAFAADGTVLTGGSDRTIRDWPAAGGDGVVLFAGAPG
ncbi:WD40 repeat domain-containing protein [Mesorhizobium sp. CO1-1-11]|uniref:WD40 repeat domain-containing protein n=1 Tax=Mesorhizobium sp. CO1-1-11 TaxID=2876636 RepID=UPI0021E2C39D|nr:WD40 repeat domain-containing protein [Mesorhizobium sp. CO1-1-11]